MKTGLLKISFSEILGQKNFFMTVKILLYAFISNFILSKVSPREHRKGKVFNARLLELASSLKMASIFFNSRTAIAGAIIGLLLVFTIQRI